MPTFKTILYLDDMRTPLQFGIDVVHCYEEFVWHLENKPMPELISFDHDLSFDHYPVAEDKPGEDIPYDSYKEKTGLHCARYIIENKLPLKHWMCHSMNPRGRHNIETELSAYCPEGWVGGFRIPYRID